MTEEQARNDPKVLAGTHHACRWCGIPGGWRTKSIASQKNSERKYVVSANGRISIILNVMRQNNKVADARDALQLQQLQERKRT